MNAVPMQIAFVSLLASFVGAVGFVCAFLHRNGIAGSAAALVHDIGRATTVTALFITATCWTILLAPGWAEDNPQKTEGLFVAAFLWGALFFFRTQLQRR